MEDNTFKIERERRMYGGVDPGVNGAIAIIDENGKVIERTPFPKIKSKLDVHELKNLMIHMAGKVDHVCLENVHAIFGSSAKSTFSFGWCCGVIEGILTALNVPFTMVTPKEWQKEMWRGVDIIKVPSKTGKKMVTDTKATSLISARRIFPNEDFLPSERCTKPHDGVVDALLMAEYCKRIIK